MLIALQYNTFGLLLWNMWGRFLIDVSMFCVWIERGSNDGEWNVLESDWKLEMFVVFSKMTKGTGYVIVIEDDGIRGIQLFTVRKIVRVGRANVCSAQPMSTGWVAGLGVSEFSTTRCTLYDPFRG
jgi:hypothetical protein